MTIVKTRREVEKILAPKITETGTLQFLLKNLYWKENNQLAWRFNLAIINQKIEAVSEAISGDAFDKPSLFIRGENSKYILPEDEQQIKQLFPSAEITTAPNAGHWVHADNPQWFFETCVEFLLR